MLAETLAVTVVVMIIFIAIYSNFMPIQGEYERRINYNDVNSQYAAFYMRKLYLDKDLAISDKGYTVLFDSVSNECNGLSGEEKDYCTKLAKELGIKEMIVTNYNFSESFKDNYRGELEQYISYLPEYKANTWEDDVGWSFTPCEGATCKSKSGYQEKIKEEVIDANWSNYTETSCGTLSNTCDITNGYRMYTRESSSKNNCDDSVVCTCPDSYQNEIDGLCYTDYSDYTLVADCSLSNTVKCDATTLYRTKQINTVYTDKWTEWTEFSGSDPCINKPEGTCKIVLKYRDERDLYRLIIKTDHGYANTPLLTKLIDDKEGPKCEFTSFNVSSILEGEEATSTLTCIDKSGIGNKDLNASNFVLADSTEHVVHGVSLVVSLPSYDAKNYSYTYNLTVTTNTDISDVIDVKIQLKESQIMDIFGNSNGIVDSSFLTINPLLEQELVEGGE